VSTEPHALKQELTTSMPQCASQLWTCSEMRPHCPFL